MNNKNSSGFNIRIDEESPDSILQEEPPEKEIKINRKIVLSTFLILCLVAVILFFAYRGIEKKTILIQKTGAIEFETLSKNMEARLASVADQNIKLEKTLSDKILSLEQQISSIRKALKKKDKAFKQLKTSKADKKELSQELNQFNKSINSIQKDLQKNSSAVVKVNTKLSELNKIINNTKTALTKTKAEITSLSSGIITKKRLDELMENERKYFRLKISQIAANMEEALSEIKKSINSADHPAIPQKKLSAQTVPSPTETIVEEYIQ